jgi:hypothetical protein
MIGSELFIEFSVGQGRVITFVKSAIATINRQHFSSVIHYSSSTVRCRLFCVNQRVNFSFVITTELVILLSLIVKKFVAIHVDCTLRSNITSDPLLIIHGTREIKCNKMNALKLLSSQTPAIRTYGEQTVLSSCPQNICIIPSISL